MRPDRARRADPRASARVLARVVAGLMVAALMGCGGGGGGGTPPTQPAPTAPHGISGILHLPGQELGRFAELEPNQAGSFHRVPPLWARSRLSLAGTVGHTVAQFGRVDAEDVFRVRSMDRQQVDLTLTFQALGGVPAGLAVVVRRASDGTEVARVEGTTSPLTVGYLSEPDADHDVSVSLTGGDLLYVLGAVLSDPGGAPLVLGPVPTNVLGQPVATSTVHASGPAAPAVSPLTAVAGDAPACAPGRVLVRCHDAAVLADLCARHGLEHVRDLASGACCLSFACGDGDAGRHDAVRMAAVLARSEGVVFAEPDWIVRSLGEPNDAEYPRQWNLHAVGAPHAWDLATGSASVEVGIVDSGVIAHPDLAGRIAPGADFISDPGIANDGDGRDMDPTDAGDAFLPTGFSSWHGTHVACIVAGAQDDGAGVSGVAPNCRVVALRALGIGGGLVSDVADAILYGAALAPGPNGLPRATPLPILNLSLGLAQDSSVLRDACDRASNRGVFLVAAAGNNGDTVLFPAAYPSVFAVSAVDGELLPTSYSAFGDAIDLAAPGGLTVRDVAGDGWPDGVLSGLRDETLVPAPYGHLGYNGTSQAAPHVAGAAALLLSLDPTLTAPELAAHLRISALDLGANGEDVAYGAGLLQVHRALERVLDDLGTPRGDGPQVHLGIRSLQFRGFDSEASIPITNGGGGVLTLLGSPTTTDDGVPWLSAALVPDAQTDQNVSAVTVTVSRIGLANGVYSGVVRLTNATGALTSFRVVMYVGDIPRLAAPLRMMAIQESDGLVRRVMATTGSLGWRYRVTNLPGTTYFVRAGEDTDGDAIICEPADFCGYFGGATAAEAVPISAGMGLPPVSGAHVVLQPPPGP